MSMRRACDKVVVTSDERAHTLAHLLILTGDYLNMVCNWRYLNSYILKTITENKNLQIFFYLIFQKLSCYNILSRKFWNTLYRIKI